LGLVETAYELEQPLLPVPKWAKLVPADRTQIEMVIEF